MLTRALLRNTNKLARIPQTNRAALVFAQQRWFSTEAAVIPDQEDAGQIETLESKNARLGIDSAFDQQKHAYVLTFPWNFPAIVDSFESKHRAISDNSYWGMFVRNSGSEVDFNNLYRMFHQYCALPNPDGIEHICEAKLAQAVNQSVQRIHFHGLDVEMANLTVHQPSIKILKTEIRHGLQVDRASNGAELDWDIANSSFYGAPCTYYKSKANPPDVFDSLEVGRKPYCVAVTALIESPMKMFVQNQNYSKILFGSDDKDLVKNVVRFEANVTWGDMYSLLPTNNKASLGWKITDFNNLMNENPYF